jgi:bifunctional non-homologous end joining protein LigD
MPIGRARDPFSHPEWLFEVKWDGFQSLAFVHKGECRLISRQQHSPSNNFRSLVVTMRKIPTELPRSAILDGEIVALDRHGKTQFKDLLFRRGEPRFYAFDLCSIVCRLATIASRNSVPSATSRTAWFQ